MAATGFVFFMIIMFFASFILTIPSIIGLFICKAYKKKKNKKAKLIIRVLLIIILLAGLVMFTIPAIFGGMIMYDNHQRAQYEQTLEAAACRRDLPRVKQLLNSGINPDQNDGSNYTALTFACTGDGSYDMAKLLIDRKCTVDIEFNGYSDGKEKGYTPLMYAVTEKQNYDLVKLLLDNKANINHKASSDGYTPLITATSFGNYTVADLLIKNGADVNATDNNGMTVLSYACSLTADETNYDFIKNLLECGALVNSKTTTLEDLLSLTKKYNVKNGVNSNDYYKKIVSILNDYGTK